MALLLCVSMLSGLCVSASAEETELDRLISETANALSAINGQPGTVLADSEMVTPGSSGSDWIAITLARCNVPESYSQYLEALKTYVEACYAEDGGLHDVKATEYHRISLTVLSLGGDPTNFGTKPDGTPIDLIADGTYNFGEKELGLQGLNGWIWALISLNASGVEVPADARYARQDMINAIISAQNGDGSFALDGGNGDVDITAMALQALSPYAGMYDREITSALNWLSLQMSDDCTFFYGSSESSESLSQVIMALTALNWGVDDMAGFVRDGQTMYTALNRFRCENGLYKHQQDDEKPDTLATVQALQALLSIRGQQKGSGYVFAYQGPIFPPQSENEFVPAKDSAVEKEKTVPEKDNTRTLLIGLATEVIVIAAITVVVLRRRNKHG